MDLEKIVVGMINISGDKLYQHIRKYLMRHNRIWLLGRSDLYRNHKKRYVDKITTYQDFCIINKGLYDYQYFNICFLNNMLSLALQSIIEKKIPRIEILNDKGENIWEWYFLQPCCGIDITTKREVELDEEGVCAFPNFQDIYNSRSISLYGKLYQDFLVFNETTNQYIDSELKEIFQEGKRGRILGVLCRGTDYTICKPKGHPVQPEISDIIKVTDKKMKELECQYLYLATEDETIDKAFRMAFPNRVLINKRAYYDEIFKDNKLTWIKDVHFKRENDDYWKGMEYLSSLYILSNCNALVAGNCGGCQAAVFMNNGRYEDVYIFDLGLYD